MFVMKLAILITGEYRTFEFCRKTMKFLDQSTLDKDVYFSTWNKTIIDNPFTKDKQISDTPITRKVTTNEIQSALGMPAKIQVHDYDIVCPKRSLAMRTGWRLGFKMIEESNTSYDYVYVLRPDLFFKGKSIFEVGEFVNFENTIGLPKDPYVDGEIDDTTFFSTYDNIKKLFEDDVLDIIAEHGNWHAKFRNYIEQKKFKLGLIPMTDRNNLIARFPMTSKTKFPMVQKNYLRLLGGYTLQ